MAQPAARQVSKITQSSQESTLQLFLLILHTQLRPRGAAAFQSDGPARGADPERPADAHEAFPLRIRSPCLLFSKSRNYLVFIRYVPSPGHTRHRNDGAEVTTARVLNGPQRPGGARRKDRRKTGRVSHLHAGQDVAHDDGLFAVLRQVLAEL